MPEPTRPKQRIDIELPNVEKSSIDKEEARRAQLRMDREEPTRTQSKIDNAEPIREKALRDNDEPTVTKIYPIHILKERNQFQQMIALTSRIQGARSPKLTELNQAEQSF